MENYVSLSQKKFLNRTVVEAYIKKLTARAKNRFENARQRFINQSLSRYQDSLRTTIRFLYPAGDATNEERFTVLCGMVGIKPNR